MIEQIKPQRLDLIEQLRVPECQVECNVTFLVNSRPPAIAHSGAHPSMNLEMANRSSCGPR
ncbi:hypothetical protein ACFFGH_25870 [Lysobacter korlensis]|uniref:Uncharacterized protein n=2 Tax=Lysobacter korlensis TaxID=553636 RepID=A0ABV6RWB5_9GAMM